jgi:hypothetical protein
MRAQFQADTHCILTLDVPLFFVVTDFFKKGIRQNELCLEIFKK